MAQVDWTQCISKKDLLKLFKDVENLVKAEKTPIEEFLKVYKNVKKTHQDIVENKTNYLTK